MKKNKGITLVSLLIYVIVMTIVIVVMSSIINKFYKSTDTITADTEDIIEFNKFNTYFLKEIKKNNNKVDNIQNNYILFTSGNSFSLVNKKIYYNNIEICNGVNEFKMALGKDGDGQDNTIINISVTLNNFKKTINYKIENIY